MNRKRPTSNLTSAKGLKVQIGPHRTCVGCRMVVAAAGLRRVVIDGAGRLRVQTGHRPLSGRGAYVHSQEKCLIAAATRGGFERSFRRKVTLPTTITLLSLILDGQGERGGVTAASNEDQDNNS